MHPFTIQSVNAWNIKRKLLRNGGNRSIHPRVVGGRTVFPKVNTAKPRRAATV